MLNNESNRANTIPITYKPRVIKIFSLIFLFLLYSTTKPTPVPVKSPPKHVENDIIDDVYSSTNITLPAHDGIKPTSGAVIY